MDPDARALRRDRLGHLVDALNWAGELLRLFGTLVGPTPTKVGAPRDPHLAGLGYVANTCAELLSGTMRAVDDGNAYVAAALLRQLVEAEYLAWAFAEDRDEAAAWLESTREERLSRWQPRHLRERSSGRFRGKDYATHCERGGHLTPDGCRALISGPTDINCAGLVADSLVHGRSAWRYLVTAADLHDAEQGRELGSLLPFDERAQGERAVEWWWEHDPFKPYIIPDGPPVAGPADP